MNFEEMNFVIDNVIDNEFSHVCDENLEGMKELVEYNEIARENNKKYELLAKALPKDLQEVLWHYSNEHETMLLLEIQHYFKKGVAAGVTNLSFLKDITGNLKFY